MKNPAQLHFVGIGGIGMSGIAEVFLNQGYVVTGTDLHESESTQRLRAAGARVDIGHAAERVHGAKVVVISSAVRADNPEVLEARRLRIPVIPRAEMLSELMRGKVGLAVAGSHGKTTTTSMLATVLTEAGLDPTLVIGGKVDSLGGSAKLGQGKFVVAEADESDGSFLHLPATYAVVTNIDNDHLDHFRTQAAIDEAFTQLVNKLPFYGLAALCGDDPGVQRCLPRFLKPCTTYGTTKDSDFFATEIRMEGMGSRFEVHFREPGHLNHRPLGEVQLHVPGRHNVLNALAVIAIATALEIPFGDIVAGLAAFRGVKRRFEVRWSHGERQQAIVDDYGHHPTEIRATLAAARNYWKGRILVVFQPHRYTRTLHCREAFLTAFGDADRVWITEIYAAGEDPIPGVSGEALAQDIATQAKAEQRVAFVAELDHAQQEVLAEMKPGDLVLCLGAGSITRLPERLAAAQK